MRIAIVSEPYLPVPPPKYGGTERVIDALIKGLMEEGHDVTLLAPGDSQVNCRLIPICPTHLRFGMTKEEHAKLERRVRVIHAKTKRLLRDLLPNIDIIHSHGFDLIDFQDFPSLTTLHGAFVFSKLRYFERRSGLFYTTVSENQQEAFPDLQYVGVCYNGLNPADFPFVEKPDNYLCFVGRFDEEKRPHLAIELALKLGIQIKLGGKLDFQGAEYFEQQIKPYFGNPLVEYLGELDFAAKIDLVSHARANLHPTGFREPFGLTVLESAYCGTPTLAIARGSMPELIEDGRTGLLVEDFVEGYHQVDRLFALDRRYIWQRTRNLFNYRTMAHQYEIAYQKVIDIFAQRRSISKKALEEMQVIRSILKGAWAKND